MDELILEPLRLERADAWLCDLVPHSCANPSQLAAIKRAYSPKAKESQYKLDDPTVPPVPSRLADDDRRLAILAEIQASGAQTLILLGDQPIRWIMAEFDQRYKRLSDFQRDGQLYGQTHSVRIVDRSIDVLPLAHPRQIAKLGQASPAWHREH